MSLYWNRSPYDREVSDRYRYRDIDKKIFSNFLIIECQQINVNYRKNDDFVMPFGNHTSISSKNEK